jgi:hypothetical protein
MHLVLVFVNLFVVYLMSLSVLQTKQKIIFIDVDDRCLFPICLFFPYFTIIALT